eukprot:scaffold1878_cov258-Pinguiococcus_pyrenoidosus.AAC.15
MELWYADDLIDDAVMRVVCAGASGVSEDVLRTAYSLPMDEGPKPEEDELLEAVETEPLCSVVLRELRDHPFISVVDEGGARAYVAADNVRASILGLQPGNSVLFEDQSYGLAKQLLERIAQGGPWGVTSYQLWKTLSLSAKVIANQVERLIAAGLVWKGVVWELNERYNPEDMKLSGSSGFRGVRTNLLKLKRYEGPEPCQPGLRYETSESDKHQFAASIVRYMLAEGLDEVPERLICEHFGISTKKIVSFRNWLKRRPGPLMSERKKVSVQDASGGEGKQRERALCCFIVTGNSWQAQEDPMTESEERSGGAAWDIGVGKAIKQVVASCPHERVKLPYVATKVGIGSKSLYQYGISQILANDAGQAASGSSTDQKDAAELEALKAEPAEADQRPRKAPKPRSSLEKDVESILLPALTKKMHDQKIMEISDVENELEKEFSLAGVNVAREQIRASIARLAETLRLRIDSIVVRERDKSFSIEVIRTTDVADSSKALRDFLGAKRHQARRPPEVLSSEARSLFLKTAALRTLGYDDVPARRLRDLHIYLLRQANGGAWSGSDSVEAQDEVVYRACSLCDERCVVSAGVSTCTNCGATLPSFERSRPNETRASFAAESVIPDLQDCIMQMPISTVFRIVGMYSTCI